MSASSGGSGGLPTLARRVERFGDGEASACLSLLEDILKTRQLSAVFQPIVTIGEGGILGYEGLIRGPLDGPFHLPADLFRVARANNLAFEVENLCCRVILERYAELSLPGKLFLNVNPMALELTQFDADVILSFLEKRGIAANKIVFELTEQIHAGRDYDLLRGVIARFRAMGFQIAIDDLGEGYSSLRRWSELLPEYIKIDMHFVRGVDASPVKQQFVRSLNDIACTTGTTIVAEGVETEDELRFLVKTGIACGQGFYFACPDANPSTALPGVGRTLLDDASWSVSYGVPTPTAHPGQRM
jgi:EAL domain-containing protein (putative c-di-GMP-specific phosphodiesterase class I)